uniref:6-phosphogluconolactonase n=1 Tax=Thaumasiovibrio occultus TaxID=1891184 RepID=UPI000B359648|nr:6-phosphogluconolactonase [Thaumasiovibrio occultus]
MMKLRVFDNASQVVDALAEEMKALSFADHPVHISLSGGSTPKMLFQRLAQPDYVAAIAWQNLHFWWGDERCVAPDDAESNFGEANALLFSHVGIPAQNIHRIRGEDEPVAEAVRFSDEMRALIPTPQDVPVFDWILLGVGADGHTASLFPGQTDYDEQALAVVATHPESGQQRVSKSARVLQAAKRISYLVLGAGKQQIVEDIYTTPAEALPYPAAKIRSLVGETEWYLDSDAAVKVAEKE